MNFFEKKTVNSLLYDGIIIAQNTLNKINQLLRSLIQLISTSYPDQGKKRDIAQRNTYRERRQQVGEKPDEQVTEYKLPTWSDAFNRISSLRDYSLNNTSEILDESVTSYKSPTWNNVLYRILSLSDKSANYVSYIIDQYIYIPPRDLIYKIFEDINYAYKK